MHASLTAILAAACGGATAWAVSATQVEPVAAAAAVAPADGGDLQLAQLERRLADLAERIEELSMSPIAPASGTAREAVAEPVDLDQIERAVRRLVADTALREEEAPVEWPGGFATATDAIRSILDLGVDSEEAAALWKHADENDQLHDLLAAMEAELENQPETSDKHQTRARAYYAAARARPSNMEGNWWVDSDNAYSRSLELDPQNWDARYQKARNQAFWPTAYGGQAEAIRHFEILVDQQERRAPEERFAQSYVWLGNLYDQQGRTEEARQVWERGLGIFPGDDWLTKKLSTLSK